MKNKYTKFIENTMCQDSTGSYRKSHLLKKAIELALLITIACAGAASAHASSITSGNIIKQINYQREIRGLSPLKEDTRLSAAAQTKAKDMIDRDYFEHYAYGLSPWSFITGQNYNYLYAGENLAMDFQTSEGMVRAWMSSPAHRKNILNPDFDEIGVGVVKGEFTDDTGTRDTIMVSDMFGKEKPKILQVIDSLVNRLKKLF